MNLCNLRDDEKKKVHAIIEKFAERGLRSLGVARQVCFFLDLKLKFVLKIFISLT